MDRWEISVRVPMALAEAAATLLSPLGEGGSAIDLPFVQVNPEDAPFHPADGGAIVRVYAVGGGGRPERETLRRRSNRALRPTGARVRLRRTRDRDWVEATMESFPAQRIGQRILIRPPWSGERALPGDILIELEPGGAFGTGDHPTTRACLEAAERLVRPGARVLDLGCGSGILSIAAARLGAGQVWALDIDPFAVDAARANVARNGLEATVRVRAGSLGPQAPPDLAGPFDIMLANIASTPLIELAPHIAAVLAAGGWLVASGVIAERAGDVAAAFERARLRVAETIADGEWRTLVAERRLGANDSSAG